MSTAIDEAKALIAKYFEGESDYIPKRKLDNLSSRDDVYDLLLLLRKIVQEEKGSTKKHPLDHKRVCEYCGKRTRITTAGCDHCDVEDK